MNASGLAQLATLMAARGIEQAEISTGAGRCRLVVAGEAEALLQPARPRESATAGTFVDTSGPGRFRSVHPARREAEVAVGEIVSSGRIMGFLEASDLLLPVVSAADGTLRHVLASDGELVGYGTRLFELG